MKKLTNKQQKMIDSVIASLKTPMEVLEDFKNANNWEMVMHMQDEIKTKLCGITSYFIWSDLNNYKAVETLLDALHDDVKLKFSHYAENNS